MKNKKKENERRKQRTEPSIKAIPWRLSSELFGHLCSDTPDSLKGKKKKKKESPTKENNNKKNNNEKKKSTP